MAKVYVGNLPFDTQDRDLEDFLGKVGDVIDFHHKRRPDGASRGFCIAEYKNEDIAERAIQELNLSEFEGRTLYVRHDNGPKPPPRGLDRRYDRSYSRGRHASRGRNRRDST
eukprot:GEMP01116892.1.p1 GENE.GEMP01116892.1~~GEMP01116892.1.p1  ORF type:complete len:112 (+),score=15.12 GEMP01116892.1:121-456(+)